MKKHPHLGLFLLSLLLSLITVLVFAPDAFLTMLARAFLPWWSLGLLLLGAFAFWKRSNWFGGVSLCGALAILPQVMVPSAEPLQPGSGHGLRLAHLNVFQGNGDHAAVIASVLEADADMVSILEVGPEWAVALYAALSERYPYQRVVPRTNCTGIALYSKRPFARAEVIEIARTPFIDATVEMDGGPLRVIAAHATSPGGYGRFLRRNAQLDALARIVRGSAEPVVLIGDLNTVHWDDAYRRFCAVSGARPINSSLELTWPSVGPFALMPLDHALIKGPLSPARLRSFCISGSDHRGLVADIRLAHAS